MHSDSSPDWVLIARCLDGEATDAEQARLTQQLAEDPTLAQDVARLRAARVESEHVIPQWDPQGAVQRVLERSAQNQRPQARTPERTPHWWRLGILPAVAILAVIVLLNRILYTYHTGGAAPARTYVTRAGEQAKLDLADGTHVRLAPGSRLDIDPNFGTTTRTVKLSGEAYFEVTASGRAPFLVRTGTITTRVLGTTFNVRRYTSDHATQVAVVSGRVAVQPVHVGKTSLIVTKNMVATVTDSLATTTTTTNIQQYTLWTTGQLVFDDTPVSTVLTTLGHWYGYTFQLSDSITASRRISATFKASEPAAALKGLQLMLDVTMSFHQDTVTLHPNSIVPSHNAASRITERRNIPETYSTSTERGR